MSRASKDKAQIDATIADIQSSLGASLNRMVDLYAERYPLGIPLDERRQMAADKLFAGQGL